MNFIKNDNVLQESDRASNRITQQEQMLVESQKNV